MSNFDDENINNLENTNDSEKVGYKSPPKANQFPKGQSGNPKGRPPKKQTIEATNIKELLAIAGSSEMTVNIAGKKETKTKLELIPGVLMNIALKGDLKAIQMVLNIFGTQAFPDIEKKPPSASQEKEDPVREAQRRKTLQLITDFLDAKRGISRNIYDS